MISLDSSLKVFLLLLLTFATIMLFNFFEHYELTGPELLKNNQFIDKFNAWTFSNSVITEDNTAPGLAILNSINPEQITQLSQMLPKIGVHQLLRLACDIKVENVPHHQGSWNTARVILVFFDGEQTPMYHLPHSLVNLSGTQEWRHYEKVFQVPTDTTQATLSAQLAQTTGTMWVKNLSLRPVAIANSFTQLRGAAIACWVLVLLWISVPIFRSAIGNTHQISIIVLAITIMFGVLMPENIKENLGALLSPSHLPHSSVSAISSTFKFTPLISSFDFFKIGHFVLFALLAALLSIGKPFPETRFNLPALLVLFALVTEVLQLFVSARNAQLGDVVIDSLGISLGLLIVAGFKRTAFSRRSG
ncbi:MAG: VanZ family protein [Methylococcaceae bacterium]|nr:VanZ family protein [Methylococcaceae bacterium]